MSLVPIGVMALILGAMLFAFFIPDASERKNKSHYIFEFLIRYGVLYGEAYATSSNLEGVAV